MKSAITMPFNSEAANSGTSATAIFAGPNQFAVGDSILISGAAASQLDGTFTITGINPSNGRITFNLTQSYSGTDTSADITATDVTAGPLNNAISRAAGFQDHAGSSPGSLEADTYLGLSTIVQRADLTLDQLSYINQAADSHAINDGGDRYTGLDRFGRVSDQFWLVAGQPATPLDRFQYGYDANSNVLYKHNLANAAFSELYHANGSSNGYDNLNRLTNFQRGTLNSTNDSITGTPSATNNWNLDALGNWTGTGSQTRTFNAQNQITGITGGTTPTYDNNGNMTQDETGTKYVYDAWNRIVKVETSTGSVLATYSYDASGNRITQLPNGGSTTDLYYAGNNVIEERLGGAVTAQYVWGLGYQNALVLRDDNQTTGSLGLSGSGLGRRLFIQQDANWNLTAAVDVNRNVVQRYIYDPYGSQTVLNSSWNAATDVAGLLYGFQGGRRDATSGLYHFGSPGRDYSVTLGRWLQQDQAQGGDAPSSAPSFNAVPGPAACAQLRLAGRLGAAVGSQWWLWEYGDGSNLYEFIQGNPINSLDPTGANRYVVSAGPHHGIAVDTWAIVNGKFVKTGVREFDFSMSKNLWLSIINAVGAVTFSCRGQVTEYSPGKLGDPISSSPYADEALLGELLSEQIMPPSYSTWFNDCNMWTIDHLYTGLSPGEAEQLRMSMLKKLGAVHGDDNQ